MVDLPGVPHAAGPDPDLAGPLALFGRFIGARDIEWRGTGQDGEAPPGLRPFRGTTLRFCDPALRVWRSTWIDPLNGQVRRFTGRPGGDDTVLDGLDDARPSAGPSGTSSPCPPRSPSAGREKFRRPAGGRGGGTRSCSSAAADPRLPSLQILTAPAERAGRLLRA